jgi:uncharacterized membrane protein YoaK (UPF0700 family)
VNDDLLLLAPMIVGTIVIAGAAVYFRDREDVQRDWQRIAVLVLAQVMLIIAVIVALTLRSVPVILVVDAGLAVAIWAMLTRRRPNRR